MRAVGGGLPPGLASGLLSCERVQYCLGQDQLRTSSHPCVLHEPPASSVAYLLPVPATPLPCPLAAGEEAERNPSRLTEPACDRLRSALGAAGGHAAGQQRGASPDDGREAAVVPNARAALMGGACADGSRDQLTLFVCFRLKRTRAEHAQLVPGNVTTSLQQKHRAVIANRTAAASIGGQPPSFDPGEARVTSKAAQRGQGPPP